MPEESKPCVPATRPPEASGGRFRRVRRASVHVYRLVRGVLALGMLLQIILVVTPLTDRLARWLDVTQPAPAEPADFAVCLGGRDQRLIRAADLYHRGLAGKVIVTNQPGAAEAMRDILVDCGVPRDRVLVDNRSYTTGDHPDRVAELPGVDRTAHRFVIVTDQEHSRRAAACFRRAGYQEFTLYAGTPASQAAAPGPHPLWRERVILLPTVAYEYTALVKYWLEGRI